MTQQEKDNILRLTEIAKLKGMGIASTADGYVLLFQRERLQALVLSGLTAIVSLSIDTDGVVETLQLNRGELQANLDAHPDQSFFMIIYTRGPIKN